MSVFSGSRYENSNYTSIKYSDGKIKKFIHPRLPIFRSSRSEQMVIPLQQNELLDEIAVRFGHKETDWYIIAEMNDIFFALDLETGIDIRIP